MAKMHGSEGGNIFTILKLFAHAAMWTMQGRMVGGSKSIRIVRKMPGRIHFMGNLHPICPVSAVLGKTYSHYGYSAGGKPSR